MAAPTLSIPAARLQPFPVPAALGDGAGLGVAPAAADGFATLLDQLGQTTPAPAALAASAEAPPGQVFAAPPEPVVPPLPVQIAPSPVAMVAPKPTRAALIESVSEPNSDGEDASETPDRMTGIAAPADSLLQVAVPAVPAVPLPLPNMVAATSPGDSEVPLPSPSGTLVAAEAVTSNMPATAAPSDKFPVSPNAQPAMTETAVPPDPATNSPQSPTPPASQSAPSPTLERAAIAQSRVDQPAAWGAAKKPLAEGEARSDDDVAEEKPKPNGGETGVPVSTPLPAAAIPAPASIPARPSTAATLSAPEAPPVAAISRGSAEQPATIRADASQPTGTKSAAPKLTEVANPLPVAVAGPDAAPTIPTVPSGVSTPPAFVATSRQVQSAPPPPPAAQVASALVEPVQVMLGNPASADPAQPRVTTIQITPVELGRVDIRIERPVVGGAKIELVAERPETLSRLVHDQSVLHQALDQAGLAPGNRTVEFSLAPAPPAGTPPMTADTGTASGNGSGSSHHRGGRYPNQGVLADDTSSPTSTVLRSVRSGIDIMA